MLVKVRQVIDRIIGAISGILFIIAVCATLIGILDRTFGLNLKTVWAEEVTRYSIIWAMFLIVGICLRRGYQTAFTLFLDKMNVKLRALFQIIIYILITLFCLLLFYYGIKSSFQNINQHSPVLQISMTYPFLSIPVGAALCLFETVSGIYVTISGQLREGI